MIAGVFFLTPSLSQSQDVIKASGGTDLSIDSVTTGGYTSISGPNIRETSSGQLEAGETIVLTLPDGYEWNPDSNVNITIETTGANKTDLEVSAGSITASEVTFNIDNESTTAGNGKGPGRVDIEGLELRPTNTEVPDEGEISNTGTTGPADANYGNLSKEAGEPDEIRVETADDGSGQIVQEQDIFAGVDLQVYAIARDIGGNFIENIALDDESDWQLINVTGDISQSALQPSDNLRSATFNSEQTGSAQIEATNSDHTITPSETITVLPRETDQMVIDTQPSDTATAGDIFASQPVIELRDQFDNTVITDNSTQITASINSGSDNLQGTQTQQADEGVITFDDLSYETAESITLLFESPDLDDLVSDEIVVQPAAPSQLLYLEEPSNTLPDNIIEPPVELQLLDEFDNEVQSDTVDVTITEEAGSLLDSGATTTESTNSEGIAIFDDLLIDSGAAEGEAQLEASFANTSSAEQSEPFQILGEGELAEFQIEAEGGGDIDVQEAGESFDIQITAVDGSGNTFTDFDQTVTISADADISDGDGETAEFTDGELSSHSITLTSLGDTRIYAENTDDDRDGRSNKFNVKPTDLDQDETELTADPSEIIADGTSSSEITLQAKDKFGNNLDTGGETIEIVTSSGTLSSDNENDQSALESTDNNDGKYTATLTSSTTIDTAIVEAFLNDQNGDKLGETTVAFTPGDLDSFAVLVPQDNGEPATQTAGDAFDITVQALDANNNLLKNFSGDLVFSSNSNVDSGDTASGNNFSGGELTHSVTLTESGENITISVEEDNLDDESGTSEEFEVVPANPDAGRSQVSANPSVIQNDGTSESTISVVLHDEFGNQVFTEENVSLSLEQLEEDGNPSSGQPDASVSGVNFDASSGIYTATLSSTNTIELVEIVADFGSTTINDVAEVDIVLPNTWEPGGGPQDTQEDWTNGDNWSQGEQPGEGDFVIIPDTDPLPELDLNISVGSFEIQQGAALTLFGGNEIVTSGNTEIDGSLDILDNTDLTVHGNLTGSGTFTAGASTTIKVSGDLSLDSFLAGEDNATTRLNGENQQIINTQNLLSDHLEVRSDVWAESGVDLIDIFQLDISDGYTFELDQDADITIDLNENITGDGTFILNNNTFVLRGDSELENIDASDGTVIFGIRLDENFEDFPDLEQQQISNLSEMQNAVINNTEGVRTFEDIVVDGNLTLENGNLIIASGKSLIAPNQTYNNGSLEIRRRISQQGWHMLGAPINSDFDDLFDGLTVQGMANSTYPDRQPNLLYYNETIQGTDNQRWRTPGDMNNSIQDPDSTGRGFFFYVFGNSENDADYNDDLPETITVSGEEYQHQNDSFTFSSVTYTAEADTGFNLVSNPWASTIDWDDDNWSKTNIDDVIYIWDPSSNDYLTWNGIDGSLENGLIKPFQAFWIKANGEDPSLSIDQSAKTTGGEFYSKTDKKPASIEFLLEADTLSKETHLTLTPDGSNDKDNQDAFRLLPFETETYLELFTTLDDGTQLSINNLARSFGEEITIPIHVGGYQEGQPLKGEYTLSWPDFGDVPEEWTLRLIDQKTGKEVNLRDNTFYSFSVSQSREKKAAKNTMENFRLTAEAESREKSNGEPSSDNRFKLYIDPGADGSDVPDEYSLGINYPNPFSSSTTIEYNTPVEGEVTLEIYDILGRKVKTLLNERQPADFHEIEWSPNQMASGVYICVMRAGGKQFSRKMTYIK